MSRSHATGASNRPTSDLPSSSSWTGRSVGAARAGVADGACSSATHTASRCTAQLHCMDESGQPDRRGEHGRRHASTPASGGQPLGIGPDGRAAHLLRPGHPQLGDDAWSASDPPANRRASRRLRSRNGPGRRLGLQPQGQPTGPIAFLDTVVLHWRRHPGARPNVSPRWKRAYYSVRTKMLLDPSNTCGATSSRPCRVHLDGPRRRRSSRPGIARPACAARRPPLRRAAQSMVERGRAEVSGLARRCRA